MLQPGHALPAAGWGCARALASVLQQQHAVSSSGLSTPSSSAPMAPAHQQRRGRTMQRGYAAMPAASSTTTATAATEPIEGPAYLYNEGLETGKIRPDPLQQVTVEKLQRLYTDLKVARPRPRSPSGLTLVDHVGGPGHSSSSNGGKSSWFSGLSSLLTSNGSSSSSSGRGGSGARDMHTRPVGTRGLYMYGGVGCGKTMLMDLFVQSAPREFQTLRTHFHDFMLDVHARLRGAAGEADPLVRVADGLVGRAKVLALDEFFVTDVADAMILHRLFARLWDQGLVLIATSNRGPDKLYEGGLQRPLFLPFIERLKGACVIHDMHSPVDYRKLAHHQGGLYFVAPDRDEEVYEAFVEAAGGLAPRREVVPVAMGRELVVPQAAGAACMFEFEELCGRPLAAADYLALAGRYHTLALRGVPVFSAARRSEAYRFVTLVDVLYEHRIRLMVSAEATPWELFEPILTQEQAQQQKQQQALAASSSSSSSRRGLEVVVDDQLGFAKDRTISRLTEMQSLEYLLAHAHRHAPELLLALQEEAGRRSSSSGGVRQPAAMPQQREMAAGL